jgi:hypothetical protein
MGTRDYFPGGESGKGVKLTVHLQLVPRSRKCGSIHPLPIRLHGVVLSYLSTGTTLPFFTFTVFWDIRWQMESRLSSCFRAGIVLGLLDPKDEGDMFL